MVPKKLFTTVGIGEQHSTGGLSKMESLKIKTKVNHFALKSRLYLKAVRSAFDELQQLQAA